MAALLLALALLTGLGAQALSTATQTPWPHALLLLPAIALLWSLRLFRGRGRLAALMRAAQGNYAERKYGFHYQQSLAAFPFSQLTAHFSNFFRLGNHSNEFPRFASGVFRHGVELPFTIFHYHFVNQREESHIEEGKRKTRTVYDHFDRWGIFVADVPALGIALTSAGNRIFPQRWSSASIAFNARHHISGRSELELARFFQPATLLMFEQALDGLAHFEIVLSDTLPLLYWSCSQDLFRARLETQTSVTSAATLAARLESFHLPHFEALLDRLQPVLNRLVT